MRQVFTIIALPILGSILLSSCQDQTLKTPTSTTNTNLNILKPIATLPPELPTATIISKNSFPFSKEEGKFNKIRIRKADLSNNRLSELMSGLPAEYRKNVILVDGINIYSTSDSLLKDTIQYQQINETQWKSENGDIITMPAFEMRLQNNNNLSQQATFAKCKTDNSGPFSRVLSNPHLSRFYGQTYLTSQAYQNYNEAAHMYTGGWSNYTAVDGGVQRNADGRYQAFLRATINPGAPGYPDGYSGYATVVQHHFQAGQWVTFDFYTDLNGVTWLVTSGTNQDTGKYESITQGFVSLPGWTAVGQTEQIKFTTSIAQPKPETFYSGAYVYSNWGGMYAGGYDPSTGWYIRPWTNSSGTTQEVCTNPSSVTYPSNSSIWNKVSSNWIDNSNYQININLQ